MTAVKKESISPGQRIVTEGNARHDIITWEDKKKEYTPSKMAAVLKVLRHDLDLERAAGVLQAQVWGELDPSGAGIAQGQADLHLEVDLLLGFYNENWAQTKS